MEPEEYYRDDGEYLDDYSAYQVMKQMREFLLETGLKDPVEEYLNNKE